METQGITVVLHYSTFTSASEYLYLHNHNHNEHTGIGNLQTQTFQISKIYFDSITQHTGMSGPFKTLRCSISFLGRGN